MSSRFRIISSERLELEPCKRGSMFVLAACGAYGSIIGRLRLEVTTMITKRVVVKVNEYIGKLLLRKLNYGT